MFLASGKDTLDDFKTALATVGKRFDDFSAVLDWGCGCGRVMRWLRKDLPAAKLHGSDYDKPAIAWMRENIPDVRTETNDELPPLAFANESFDLIIGYSIFTHFNEEYQDAWLSELHRVTAPGGLLVLSFHGAYNWAYTRENILQNSPARDNIDQALESKGFAYFKQDGWDEHFPDFYHTAWHTKDYVQAHWSKWFDVLAIIERGARPTQDFVVLRRQ